MELQTLLSIERRLMDLSYRLTALERGVERMAAERKKQSFDAAAFFGGLWGKAIIILALLAAQVPMKDALLAVFK